MGAPRYRNTQVRKCTSGYELLNQALCKPPLTVLPQARKPTWPLMGSVHPPSRAVWPHPTAGPPSPSPPYTRKKTKTSRLPSSSADSCTISHIWFSFFPPKTKTTQGREEVGGVRAAADLCGGPFHIIDISSIWWGILKLTSPPFFNMLTLYMDVRHLETMLIVTDVV